MKKKNRPIELLNAVLLQNIISYYIPDITNIKVNKSAILNFIKMKIFNKKADVDGADRFQLLKLLQGTIC